MGRRSADRRHASAGGESALLTVTPYIIAAGILLLVSVITSKVSDRFGIPALLLFLVLGMLAGSDGPGGIYFDSPGQAQSIGVVALALILFSGGLSTKWAEVRPVLKAGLILATAGVLITALLMGLCAHMLLGVPPRLAMLLGAIVSSTDAAAVFSVLRSKGVGLRGQLKPLLELESASNDPMAIFMTVGLIQLVTAPDTSAVTLVALFAQQMLVGAIIGYCSGRLVVPLVNHLKLAHEGLYPVLTLALVLAIFGATDALGGSGFLAVYLAGIVLGNREFLHKRSLLRFHDGLAWLMQITMFLALGLLVFPSRLPGVAGAGLLLAFCLILVARPLSVLIGLLPSRLDWRERLFTSWVGLRGAAPIIMATFPLMAGIPEADVIFNVVFFVVLTSVLLQGTTITLAARVLGVDAPLDRRRAYPIEYTPMRGMKSELKEIPVAPDMVGRAIVELNLPADFLIILIARGDEFLITSGGTVIEPGDTMLTLTDEPSFRQVQARWGVHEAGTPAPPLTTTTEEPA